MIIQATEIHKQHETMLQVQEELAQQYKYKPLPPILSILQRKEYEAYIPEEFRAYVDGTSIYTMKGTIICTGLTKRIYVCGDYGIFLEAEEKNMVHKNIMIKHGQEYRIYEQRFSERVKYHWLTAKDNSGIKIYFQQKTVDYADYIPGMYYFSPYECTVKK